MASDNALPLQRTFTFSVEEYAALVQAVDEGMWELAVAGDVAPAHERVCAILGIEAYCAEDYVAGVIVKTMGGTS